MICFVCFFSPAHWETKRCKVARVFFLFCLEDRKKGRTNFLSYLGLLSFFFCLKKIPYHGNSKLFRTSFWRPAVAITLTPFLPSRPFTQSLAGAAHWFPFAGYNFPPHNQITPNQFALWLPFRFDRSVGPFSQILQIWCALEISSMCK